jgi:hypothetical protein
MRRILQSSFSAPFKYGKPMKRPLCEAMLVLWYLVSQTAKERTTASSVNQEK